ncbi:AAA family ATPase [Rhodococcus sp. BP-349]|uniref:UvrD-helicase domain-containing protein n=1 Tax=unclassified Rhodococcus (in: high G+C Gram-positive bacteria) TaxID=192944 RepID=UPI001C9B8B4A|nr:MULTISPECIES: UvrD-helicase domain-containing protein [unclassified Rhodococcus (in: high G+C Gram-positive bacteria)]MBY6540052.1 AAA family ATPase [Rhodococcus sp. BP-363]MBY6543620.1 AAA family ATPase [Rhodococcus sp. BP-369]MBY6562850.1 AAA family ATPase [Rhodococcus sp. BP-370]MBY6577142.1 AAA family ATPase [Rhodococcus sp. BP-364]MBY6586443.1 AAA family ATPase [Rhodococcus sp. BP-358]
MHINLDESQRAIVHANYSDRRIVTAGPGAGKTATAVALVEEITSRTRTDSDDGSQVLFVSFSRTSINASINAFGSGLDKDTDAVVAMTLDSLAWELTGTRNDQFAARIDFDAIIELAINKVCGDYGGELDDVVHLIVDEAQDMTNVRRKFLLALIDRLPADSGLTVFGDPLQSIYEFLDSSAENGQSAWDSLLTGLRDRDVTSFLTLDGEYRARRRGPRKVSTAARAMRHVGATERIDLLDELVTDLSLFNAAQFGQQAADWVGTTAVLVRTNAGVVALHDELAKAGFHCHARHRDARQATVAPWVADLWEAVSGRPVTMAAFDEFASFRDDVESGWFRLLLHATHAGETVSWNSFARICSTSLDSAQPWFTPDVDVPVISTIHQAKGLEWDNVAVADVPTLLRPAGKREPESELLFVALSRGRDKVVIMDWEAPFYRTAPRSNLMYRPHPRLNFPTEVLITPESLRLDDMIGDAGGQACLRSAAPGSRVDFELLSSGSGWPNYRCLVSGEVIGATTPEFGRAFSQLLRGRGAGGWPQLGSVTLEGVESRWSTIENTKFWLQARPFGMAEVLRKGPE